MQLPDGNISAEHPFDFNAFDSDTQTMILDAQERAFDRALALFSHGGWGPETNGWLYAPPNHGNWGHEFIRRAFGTYTGGMYPTTSISTYANRERRNLWGNYPYSDWRLSVSACYCRVFSPLADTTIPNAHRFRCSPRCPSCYNYDKTSRIHGENWNSHSAR
jgi:hypothetical protein